MSFCYRCGTAIPENANFCPACGARTEAPNQPVRMQPQVGRQPGNAAQQRQSQGYPYTAVSMPRKKKWLLPVFCIAAAAIVAAVTVFFLLFRGKAGGASSCREPVEHFFHAVEQKNAQLIVDVLPDDVVDCLVTGYYSDEAALAADLEEYLMGDLAEYEQIGIAYTIVSETACGADDIADLAGLYQDEFHLTLPIEAAYELQVAFTLTADQEQAEDTMDFLVIQVDGAWFLDLSTF